MIGTAFYHAFGYHVVEVYLAEIDRDELVHLREGDDARSAERHGAGG